ncbi:MAG: DNA repair protein RadC [Bacteroidota bacterium]|nr:DNA repair protein RadC [Bacteroidota bacterium]
MNQLKETDKEPAVETVNKFSIREWAEEDRPREKLMLHGASSLSNAELLAILLGSGSRNETALDLAKRILNYAGNNLNELGKLSIETLCRQFTGVGPVKAIILTAALEMGKRRRSSEAIVRHQIRNSRDIYELFHAKLADLAHEECWLLLMNNQHKVIESIRISHGGVSETTVDPKIVLKYALDKLATAIVLCHNHPSGSPYPSTSDDKITHKLKQACANLDIQLTDHLIFSETSYYSYADEGKI